MYATMSHYKLREESLNRYEEQQPNAIHSHPQGTETPSRTVFPALQHCATMFCAMQSSLFFVLSRVLPPVDTIRRSQAGTLSTERVQRTFPLHTGHPAVGEVFQLSIGHLHHLSHVGVAEVRPQGVCAVYNML